MSQAALPPGYRLVAYEAVGSTMDEARRLAQEGAEDGTLIWAREQTAGRGRQGRGWSSPVGNLYLSLLLRPEGSALAAAQIGFAAGLALAEALEPALARPERLRLKWPNDLLVDGAKLAGILLESQSDGQGSVAWVILGVGCNLASSPGETPYPATSLAAAGGRLEPEATLFCFVERFAFWRSRLATGGFPALRQAWLSRAAGLGGLVTARLPREVVSGTFRDLAEDGALLLEVAGTTRRVTAADVFFG